MTTVTQGPCLSCSIAQLFRDELLRRLPPECERDRLLRDFDEPLLRDFDDRLVLRCERDDPLECERDRLCDLDDPLRLVLRCERDLLLLDLFGTFAPSRRASDSPIAIACFGFVTFLPLRPLFSFPRFISCISSFTFWPARGLYFLPPDERCEDELFLVAIERSPFIVLGSIAA